MTRTRIGPMWYRDAIRHKALQASATARACPDRWFARCVCNSPARTAGAAVGTPASGQEHGAAVVERAVCHAMLRPAWPCGSLSPGRGVPSYRRRSSTSWDLWPRGAAPRAHYSRGGKGRAAVQSRRLGRSAPPPRLPASGSDQRPGKRPSRAPRTKLASRKGLRLIARHILIPH